MDSPKRLPVSERSNTDSVPEKSSPKASPSLSQGLIDITKQFLNWPKFGIDFNSAEEEDSSKKEEAEQETENPDYTLAKAQWTPKWPENFDDSETSQDTVISAQTKNSSKKEETEQGTESSEYTLAKAQWTPKWPENFDDSEISQDTVISAQNKNSPKQEEKEQETEIPEYTLAKAQWTPKWPENFDDLEISQDTDLSNENDTDPSVQNDTDPGTQNDVDPSVQNITDLSDQNDTDQNDQSNTEPSVQSDANPNAPKDALQNDIDQNDQNNTYQKDQEGIDQIESERSSKVSFETTDYSKTTDEMDKDTESESSDGEQPEFTVYREDDVPTLILQIPSWTEDNDDPEEFDNLLYEIPPSTDSKTNVEEDISGGKKWFVEPGNNRNYIRALINYDLNDSWPRTVKSKGVFERAEQPRKFKWVINYDNMNYIRSLLRPEIFESILERDLLKSKETYTSHQYREMLVE